METTDSTAWYCVQALVKKERLAAAAIKDRAGVETFAPLHHFVRPTRVGKKRFVEALFPGYIFVRCDIGQCGRLLLSINGVRDLVRYGDHVPTIDDAFIQSLKAELAQHLDTPAEDEPEAGSTVQVVSGPFASFTAQVLSCDSQRQRVALLLDFLGRELTIELDRAQVLTPRQSLPCGARRACA